MSLLMSCRGLGALLGPLVSGYWTGDSQRRMRLGILFGFVFSGLGYLMLGFSPNLLLASAGVVLAHAGGSMLWVFSSTLLQLQTDDRLRGRVFSAEFALSVITMALSSYVAGLAVDHNMPVAHVAIAVGLVMFLPAALWAAILRPGGLQEPVK